MRRAALTIFLALLAAQAAAEESLRALAERKDLKVGVMALDPTWDTPEQQAVVSREFNVVTVGAYWNRTRPSRGQFNWALTDSVVAWADGAGLGVHLHPLLYPANEQTPVWVRQSGHSEALAILDEHIGAAMDRYRGVVDVWDVVNEAVAPSAQGGYRNCWWLEAIGPDYVIEAFRMARRHDPDATLLYNEHSIEQSNQYQTGRWNTTKEILTALAAEDLVDGLGWQLHTTPQKVSGGEFALEQRMEWV